MLRWGVGLVVVAIVAVSAWAERGASAGGDDHARHAQTVQSPQSATGAAVDYHAILGRDADDPAVVAFIDRHNCERTGRKYRCSRAGMELLFDQDGTLAQIGLVGPHVSGFYHYTGTLPAGLRWSDTLAKVRNKLGPPASFVPGSAYARAVGRYPELSITVTFDPRAGSSPSAELCHVYVQAA